MMHSWVYVGFVIFGSASRSEKGRGLINTSVSDITHAVHLPFHQMSLSLRRHMLIFIDSCFIEVAPNVPYSSWRNHSSIFSTSKCTEFQFFLFLDDFACIMLQRRHLRSVFNPGPNGCSLVYHAIFFGFVLFTVAAIRCFIRSIFIMFCLCLLCPSLAFTDFSAECTLG